MLIGISESKHCASGPASFLDVLRSHWGVARVSDGFLPSHPRSRRAIRNSWPSVNRKAGRRGLRDVSPWQASTSPRLRRTITAVHIASDYKWLVLVRFACLLTPRYRRRVSCATSAPLERGFNVCSTALRIWTRAGYCANSRGAATFPARSATAFCWVSSEWIFQTRCLMSALFLALDGFRPSARRGRREASPCPSKRMSSTRSPLIRRNTVSRSPHNGFMAIPC